MSDKVTDLADAVRTHVHDGDTLHVVGGHWRWTAAAYEVLRQFWGREPGFSLVMGSLTSLGALFFRGGLVRHTATTYSGDTFPIYTPNPVMAGGYRDGGVTVEHWSFLSLTARLRAGALGAPAAVVRSVGGSSLADQDAYGEVDSPFAPGERVGLVAPLQPDVTLVHAPIADRQGHVAFHPPLLEGLWGAWGAKRGTVVTVERIVDDIRPWRHLVRLLPRHVAAICEAPLGAHPGGLHVPNLPVDSYGEDIPFWCDVREACRDLEVLDQWIHDWVLDVGHHGGYVERLGAERRAWLAQRADPDSWRDDAEAHPPDLEQPPTPAETAAVVAARHLEHRLADGATDVVLAGAGLANLAAWYGVARARDSGVDVRLTAELGLWGYEPTLADPYIFNHRSFPSAEMLADADTVLGGIMGGRSAFGRSLACIGAAQIDRRGDINSTEIPGGPFLVGSGGGNDVASAADELVVVNVGGTGRLVDEVGYVTSPGRAVSALCTSFGVLVRGTSGELELAAVVADAGADLDMAAARARAECGWELQVREDLMRLAPPSPDEVAVLRRWDPTGLFLGTGA